MKESFFTDSVSTILQLVVATFVGRHEDVCFSKKFMQNAPNRFTFYEETHLQDAHDSMSN